MPKKQMTGRDLLNRWAKLPPISKDFVLKELASGRHRCLEFGSDYYREHSQASLDFLNDLIERFGGERRNR